MPQAYAGVLGMLACGLVLARGLLAGRGVESTMLAACLAMFGFAALGWIAGLLAERFVEESVRARFQAALASLEADQQRHKTNAAT